MSLNPFPHNAFSWKRFKQIRQRKVAVAAHPANRSVKSALSMRGCCSHVLLRVRVARRACRTMCVLLAHCRRRTFKRMTSANRAGERKPAGERGGKGTYTPRLCQPAWGSTVKRPRQRAGRLPRRVRGASNWLPRHWQTTGDNLFASAYCSNGGPRSKPAGVCVVSSLKRHIQK